jgi:hypothetical protein
MYSYNNNSNQRLKNYEVTHGGIAKVIVQIQFPFMESVLIIKSIQIFVNVCPPKLQVFHTVIFSLSKWSVMRVLIAPRSTM